MSILSIRIGIESFPMVIVMLLVVTGTLTFYLQETSPRDLSRLTNRSAIEIFATCHTGDKAYVNVIEACRKMVYI